MMKKLIILILVMALTPVLNISCAFNQDDSQVKKSLKEAGEVLGIEIPWPHYLPEGYEMKNVLVSENTSVTLMISNNKNKSIGLEIIWKPTGIIPYKIDLNAPTVKFDGTTGQLVESGETKIGIVWNLYPERYNPGLIVFKLLAPKEFPVSELTFIAESVGWH